MRKLLKFLQLTVLSLLLAAFSESGNPNLEQQVGQLLIPHFHGQELNDESRFLIEKLHIGGVIYYSWANELKSTEQVRSLSESLQAYAEKKGGLPLLIAVDQEGGRVSHLEECLTHFPGNKALGIAGDPLLAREAAEATARELRAVGINMNFAPVVDVNSNLHNPVIGTRAFGESPDIVVLFGREAIKGSHKGSILTALKHYPGHGSVDGDSHKGVPEVSLSFKELEHGPLIPFKELQSETDAIMTGHLLVPALDPDHPVTFSSKAIAFLRETLKFKGALISDSLAMGGALQEYDSIEEAAIAAVKAGCDLLLLGGKVVLDDGTVLEHKIEDVERVHKALVEAFRTGQLPIYRLAEATARIKKLKTSLSKKNPPLSSVPFERHKALAKEIATKALHIIEGSSTGIFPLEGKKIALFSPENICSKIEKSPLLSLGEEVSLISFTTETNEMLTLARKADVLLICTNDSWKHQHEKQAISRLLNLGLPIILIVTGDPLDSFLFPESPVIVQTFSATPPSFEAAYEILHNHP